MRRADPTPTIRNSDAASTPGAWEPGGADQVMQHKDQLMQSNIRAPRRLAGLVICLGLIGVVGCGDDSELARRYRVSGTVTYKGKPVDKGLVSFRPTQAGGRAAHGTISGGSYSLTTATDNDGALPGTYQVSIIARDTDIAKAQADARAKGRVVFLQKVAAQAQKEAKSLIPAKYESPDTSGLTREVKEQPNRIDLELTD
jgi:hypothetical protein